MKRGPLRIVALLMLAGVAATAAWLASGLAIEQDNVSMQSDEALADTIYETFQQQFDSDNELMVTITRDDLPTADGKRRLGGDIEWLQKLPGVQSVFFPDTPQPDAGFVSDDGKTVGLLITLQSGLSREDRLKILDTLRLDAPGKIEGTVHAIGLPLLKASVARHIARDQTVVTPLSGAVMLIMLALLFRRLAGVVLPALVIGLSLVSTLGLYAACGHELNSITSLLPPVVIVLSVSVAVHLFDAWLHTVDAGTRGEEAIRTALLGVWKPCVFTAAMTAAGLLSLYLSPIPAVRLFGLFSAIGVSLSVFFAFIVFPVGLAWAKEKPLPGRSSWLRHLLELLAGIPVRRPSLVLLAALGITLAAVWQARHIENNTDLIGFFKKSDPTYIAHDAANRSFGSVRSLDVLVRKTDGSAFDFLNDLPALVALTEQIEAIPDVVRTASLLDVIPAAQSIPEGEAPPTMNRFLADKGRLVHLQVQLGDIGSARAADIGERIREAGPNALGPDWEVMPTGAYYQVVRDSNQLVATLLKSFAMTLIIVLVSTCLLFRSIAVLLPAFIPNILPIIWGAGLMGLLHIDLSTGTTMVAAVVIGLAVDDTIHYLHHFQTYRHLPVGEATQSTTHRIGRAVIVSSIVLVGGFWMGAFGSFIPTNTFALLTGCMMVSALVCDLLVLPAWLNLIHAKPHPKKPL